MTALSLFLALVLMVSAAHKLAAPQRMAEAAARLCGVSPALGTPLAFAAAALEAISSIAVLLEGTHLGGAMAAGTLWCGYGALLFARRGQRLDCGCDLAARTSPVGTIAIVRPFALAAMALLVALVPGSLSFTVETPFAALALLALWFAVAELSALPSHLRTR